MSRLFHPLPSGDNGAALTAILAEDGVQAVRLVPGARYVLQSAIVLRDGQTLATDGYPSVVSGQQALLETRGEGEAVAVNMFNRSDVTLACVHINGCRGWGRHMPKDDEEKQSMRREGKLGWLEGGGSLVWCGGPESRRARVEGCRLEDPRGWTALHVVDWAQNAQIKNNVVGPCGQEAPAGPWADGLSIAGKDTLVEGNTIIDATDGAIVVFCAPGSQIVGNTIIARGRDLLGGINLVDEFPYENDYGGTRVAGNTIRTEGAYIRLGIGIGPCCWAPGDLGKNVGGTVLDNTLGPGTIGYGIGISGARDFTVQGNKIDPSTTFVGDTSRFHSPTNAPPTAFLIDPGQVQNCSVQDDFVTGRASWLIGIEAAPGRSLLYSAGQLQLDSRGQSSSGAGGIHLEGTTMSLAPNGILCFRSAKDGAARWSSGTGREGDNYDPVMSYSRDGLLTIKSRQGHVLYSPTDYLAPYLARLPKPDSQPSLLLANDPPFLTLRDSAVGSGNILFASHYVFGLQFELKGGAWIALAPVAQRGIEGGAPASRPPPPPVPQRPSGHHLSSLIKDLAHTVFDAAPPIPPRSLPPSQQDQKSNARPTFLFLDPSTAQLVLHSSVDPTHPTAEATHWTIPGPSSDITSTWLVFQGDGNLVLYAQNKAGDTFVPWASGTNGDEEDRGDKIVLRGEDEQDGPAFLILKKDGSVRFDSRW